MVDSTIIIKLRGDIPSGTIDLRKLSTFSEAFQNTIDEMAYSLELTRGAKSTKKQIVYETSLSLVGIKSGSTELVIEKTERPTIAPIFPNLVENTFERLIDGIEIIKRYQPDIRQYPIMPDGWNEGIVKVVYDLGKVLSREISEIELEISSPNIKKSTIYDQPVRAKMRQMFSEARERIESITGQLLLVDFKENNDDRYKCQIYPNVGNKDFITCYFDEEIADQIEAAVRKTVGVIGIASYDAVTGETNRFDIKEILIFKMGTDITEFDSEVREALRLYRLENDTHASFARGWQQVVTGQTHDISTLWDDFDDE